MERDARAANCDSMPARIHATSTSVTDFATSRPTALQEISPIAGQVGRGSFVRGETEPPAAGCRLGHPPSGHRWQRGIRPGSDQLRDVAALARPVSAGRFPRQLRRGAGPPRSRRHPATRLAQRLRTAAPPPDGGSARAAARRAGRRPADHQRLPAGARPDRPRAAAARAIRWRSKTPSIPA